MGRETEASGLRLAELVCALAFATDLARAMEHELRTCLLAVHLGELLGLDEDHLSEVYYVVLLRWISCAPVTPTSSRHGSMTRSPRTRGPPPLRSGERTVEVASASALWYSTGLPVVPIRWVVVRDPQGEFATQALLCTDLGAKPEQILRWFVLRWQMETTFQEARRHLGVETQRQWSELAIRRTTPALLGLFSLVTLLAHQRIAWSVQAVSGGQHGTANLARRSRMLWRWYARSYGRTRLFGGL